MSANHTPGPWNVIPENRKSTVAKVCLPSGGLIADVSSWWVDTESAKANARLIAAAPTMLEVLEYVLSDLNSELDYETGVIIRAAIAKAKGE